jgi:Tfp pilus assembly protein PilX
MPARAPNFARPERRDQRGSVLIVALLVAALIAVALGSYLNLNLSSARLAKRTFNGYAALNLAEAGTEEGVWSFNRANGGDRTAWDGWETGDSAAWRKFTRFEFGGNATGWVKVYVNNTTPSATVQPKIVAQSSLGAPGETPALKMIEVTLRRRSYFANGLVAKNSVAFNGGNATVDSWNSDPDNNASTAAVPYSAAVRRDRGSIASTAVINTAVVVSNSHVWGYVATGGAQPQVGAGGSIRGASTPATTMIDPNRVSLDFTADFAAITAPVDGTVISKLGATLGTEGESTKWRIANISLTGNETLTILGDVTLVLTAATGDALSVAGNASLIVPEKSSLTIYTEADVRIGGKGLANGNTQPISCQIWGTAASFAGQAIDVAGNGDLKAVIYAPKGDIKIAGNGHVMGSMVGRNITLTGNAAFHYDEALAAREANEPFTIAKWRELASEAERATYLEAFSKF